MKFEKLQNYSTGENTYIVYDENTLNGFITDPAYGTDKIIDFVNIKNIKLKYIFITHCHYDHIENMEELREKLSLKLVCGDKAGINITDPCINLSFSGLGYEISAKKADIILNDGEEFIIDGITVKCIYTPGHTNCSVCYLIGNDMFCGDTLFLRNCGRWDLPTGNEETLIKSVKEKIYTLDENIILHPGHGNDTSIGYEKKFNFYIKS